MVCTAGKQVNLLVVASPNTPELSVLQQLPPEVKVVATGQTLAEISKQLSDEQWGSIDALLNCGVGKFAGKREYIQVGMYPRIIPSGTGWSHSQQSASDWLTHRFLL
jgi:hypothetical protein